MVDRAEGLEPPPLRLRIDQLRTHDALRDLCMSLLIASEIQNIDPQHVR